MKVPIELWVCPSGHYYGATSTHGRNLASIPNLQADMQRDSSHNPADPKVIGFRGDCQQCRSAGRPNVKRQRFTFIPDTDEVSDPIVDLGGSLVATKFVAD